MTLARRFTAPIRSVAARASEKKGFARGIALRPGARLIELGGAISPYAADYVADVPFDIVLADATGGQVGARLEDLPQTKAAVELALFLKRDLAAKCIAWFTTAGTLSAPNADALLRRAFDDSVLKVADFF